MTSESSFLFAFGLCFGNVGKRLTIVQFYQIAVNVVIIMLIGLLRIRRVNFLLLTKNQQTVTQDL